MFWLDPKVDCCTKVIIADDFEERRKRPPRGSSSDIPDADETDNDAGTRFALFICP